MSALFFLCIALISIILFLTLIFDIWVYKTTRNFNYVMQFFDYHFRYSKKQIDAHFNAELIHLLTSHQVSLLAIIEKMKRVAWPLCVLTVFLNLILK